MPYNIYKICSISLRIQYILFTQELSFFSAFIFSFNKSLNTPLRNMRLYKTFLSIHRSTLHNLINLLSYLIDTPKCLSNCSNLISQALNDCNTNND